MRINKFIASNSNYSRRKADELLLAGKIRLNNKIVKELGTLVDPEKDTVQIERQTIKPQKKINYYFALHKPSGYVSTRDDELNRPKILDLLPQNLNLKPVGRLDKDTEGLIFLTNDGDFINRLTHPKFECEKEYFLKIEGELSQKNKEKLEKGIKIEGRLTAPSKIKILKSAPSQSELKIVIHEGRKRQIRKMFAGINHPVKYLQRIRIGEVRLDSLPKGKYRPLTAKEIHGFKPA